jgi:hypothetical protein
MKANDYVKIIGLDWVGLDWIGLDLIGMGWIVFDCIRLERNSLMVFTSMLLRRRVQVSSIVGIWMSSSIIDDVFRCVILL